ncbi:peroxidase skpo-1-like [Uranotaenia lowii]|uniref:peroxidase skpo-1-like n=1 Tax=Uranotaenia lowii TaxID=190385 RepID=UPI0024786FD5|nr:peroxidase skpo-1-like [Uranotaenia lowii]
MGQTSYDLTSYGSDVIRVKRLTDIVEFPEVPRLYENYHHQCGIPVPCSRGAQCPNVRDWRGLEHYAQEEACSLFEAQSALAHKKCYLIDEKEYDFDMFFTLEMNADEEAGAINTMTTEILLRYLANHDKCAVRKLLEGNCYKQNNTLDLKECQSAKTYKCKADYPYRTYDGVCNNIQHPTWGKAGNPLKHEIAPCFDDFVNKPRRSVSGRRLPNNRMVIAEIQKAMNEKPPATDTAPDTLNMFSVFFSEFVNSDMVGRMMKRARNFTEGFRGCRSDGSGISRFISPMVAPLKVPAEDSHYGPRNVECLNFSPIENANDQCHLKYSTKRNGASSYLDLSSVYGSGEYDSEGKLVLETCGAAKFTSHMRVITVQFLSIAALFSRFHNYCIDHAKSCSTDDDRFVVEKCRTLVIGVYQKIIYEELIPKLFGPEFHKRCDFKCEYDPHLESSVSTVYVNGPGRFQHIWIPENLTIAEGDSQPLYLFFENYENFDCVSILKGMFNDSIVESGLADSITNTFYSKDGKDGHCLPCLDLERGRDAGLCPLLSYKHYLDSIIGRNNQKCYRYFDDLTDIFDQNIIKVFKKHYESPMDLDVLFSIFENRTPRGSNLPTMVAASTCQAFKLLKCSDRFFYEWNPFYTEGTKQLISMIDLKTLLALFGDMKDIPLHPFGTQSATVAASTLRFNIEKNTHLFCQL